MRGLSPENDTADHKLVKGPAFVTTPGDVDDDKGATIYDVVRMACMHSASVSDPLYDPCTDIDDYGNADYVDVAFGATNYRRSAWPDTRIRFFQNKLQAWKASTGSNT